MASQTTYYGNLTKPELDGGGVVTVVTGTHKFKSSATVATLTVPFKNAVLGVQADWVTRPAKKGRILKTTAVISTRAIIMQRSTGTSSGMTFWYKLIGW